MDVDLEPLSSQDNIEDCIMTGVEENVNCTCDCGGNSSKCIFVTVDDIINQTFETLDAAYNLYVSYARCVGFGVHKGDTTHEKDGTQCRRRFFCNKEGKRAEKYISNSNRKREHKPLTRTGCEAMLAVYFDMKTSTWRVKKLVEKHNHDLVPQYLDLDNHVQRTRRVKLNGRNSNATISYLLGKVDVDPMAMKKCTVRNDGDNLGDKTGSGTQASFHTEEVRAFPKDPVAFQGTSAVPNIEVDASM
ncbi:hypothetical protein AHAS_Ahas18G0227700 [Arachis hypogaea]